MSDPRDTFYRQSLTLHELKQKGILEIAYQGNIGFHELMTFYGKATEDQKNKLEYYLKNNMLPESLHLIEMVTGTKLITNP